MRTTNGTWIRIALGGLAAMVLSALVGCGGGSDATTTAADASSASSTEVSTGPGASTGTGTATAGNVSTGILRVALTDAPGCGYDSVKVTVDRVRVHQSDTAADVDGGWSEIVMSPPKQVELLSLTNGVLEELGQTPLPAGHYSQLRLVLAENSTEAPWANAVTPTGETETALKTPSAQQSGLKMNVDMTVAPNQMIDLVLDFDACKSVVRAGKSGQYLLKPVVSVVPRYLSGAATYTIGGTVVGLAEGAQVTLKNNGADPLTVSADGAFTFVTPIAFNGSYAVTVDTQPTGQTCTVSNGSGSGVVANVTNVTVTCSTNTFTIGGTVAGLAAGASVTLSNNSADPLTVNADGAFTFVTPVAFNGSYVVTVGIQPTGQTCTASNGSGSGVVANVTNVTVTCSTNTFAIGGTVSGLTAGTQVTLNNNGSNPTTVVTNGAFTFTTPVAYNGSYAVTVGTQPIGGLACTVAGGSGAGVTANVTGVNVNCRFVFAYVVNYGDGVNPGTVSQYTVGADGALTSLGTPVATGVGPRTVVVDRANRYAYVANAVSGSVSQYTIGLNGSLTPMTPASVPSGSNPWSVAVDQSGQYAYVTNASDNNISQFTIGAGGNLVPMSTATVAAGTQPYGLTVDPTGRYAYVANFWGGKISQYTIGGDGALTPMTPATVTVGVNPFSVAVDPAGRYAYVTNYGDQNVMQYTIGASGALTAAGTPAIATGGSPWPVTIDPTGQYAYWANNAFPYSISQCTTGLDGALNCGSVGVVSGTKAQYISIDPTGRYAYVVNSGDNTVSQYTIGLGGALTPISGAATISTGATPFSITTTH